MLQLERNSTYVTVNDRTPRFRKCVNEQNEDGKKNAMHFSNKMRIISDLIRIDYQQKCSEFLCNKVQTFSLRCNIMLHDKGLELTDFLFYLPIRMNRWPIVSRSRWCVISWRKILFLFLVFFNICVIRLRVLNLWRLFFLNWQSFYFNLYVVCILFFQIVTNAEKLMLLKGTNAIQISFA